MIYNFTIPTKFSVTGYDGDYIVDDGSLIDVLAELDVSDLDVLTAINDSISADEVSKNPGLAPYLEIEPVESVTIQAAPSKVEPTAIVLEIEVLTSRELEVDEFNKLVDELNGQMSDGWGEGFEQREIMSVSASTEVEDYDEEEDEEYSYTEYYTAYVYCSPDWQVGIG